MDLSENLRMSPLNFNFVTGIILKIIFSNAFLRSTLEFFFFFLNYFFAQHIMMENSRPEEKIIIKDIRNLSRLKKELNCTAIKDIRNLFRRKKETK